MTDAELSKELALALGYAPESVRLKRSKIRKYIVCQVCRYSAIAQCYYWRVLDYRDPTVCLPLIKWLGERHDCGPWHSHSKMKWMTSSGEYDTLEAAVARAVIAVKGKP